MSLLRLPKELLHAIIKHAGVESFEGIVLTCKQLYHCGQHGLIAEHNEMKKRFTNLGIMARQDHYLSPDLADLLLAIAIYPEVAYFARSLTIKSVEPASVPEGEDPRLQEPGLSWLRANGVNIDEQQARQLAQDIVKKNSWVRSAYREESVAEQSESLEGLCKVIELVASVQRDKRDDADMRKWDTILRANVMGVLNTLVGLLLASLPKLREFSCSWDLGLWKEDVPSRYLLPIMSAHTKAKDRREGSVPLPQDSDLISPLQNLEEVHYCPGNHDPDQLDQDGDRIAFIELSPFLKSKTIRRLYANHICATGRARDPWSDMGLRHFSVPDPGLYQPRAYSSLQHLELASSYIDEDGLKMLLEGTPYLTTFRYSHKFAWHDGDGLGWNADKFVGTIQVLRPRGFDGKQHPCTLAEQIEDLAIGIEDDTEDLCYGITSLREFTALKKLAIDVRLFLGPTEEQAEEQNEDIWDEWVEKRDDQRMIDILPKSLEELEIEIPDWHEISTVKDVERLFLGFAEGRDDKLPNLRKVVVRAWMHGEMVSPTRKEIVTSIGAEGVHSEDKRLQWRANFDRMHKYYL